MTGHAIQDGRPVCLEPETAECRARWDYNECGCENFSALDQNPDGSWSHYAYSIDADDDVEHRSNGTYPANACNICNWLNDDLYATGPGETWAFGAYAYDVDLPDGLIEVEWDYDFYTWDYTEPRVIGALIGRITVARWADELGVAA